MAAAEPLQKIKAELTCPVCLELFWNPVTSECGHSFCRECIARLCQGDGDVACPQCKEKLQKRHLRPNRELKNIVEFLRSQTVKDPRGGNMCERHQQPLQLFCREDETLICVVCERSQAHRAHTVIPVEEAVQEYWVDVKSLWSRISESLSQSASVLRVRKKAGVSPAGQGAAQTESGGHTGRKPGSEREHGHKQASLDRAIHTISSTREAAEHKVDVKGVVSRFDSPTSPGRSQVSAGDQAGVSPAGQGAAQTESGGDTGREPGSEPAAEKQEETGSHVVRVWEEAPTPKYGLDQATQDSGFHSISNTTEGAEPQADAPSRGDSLQDQTPAGATLGPGAPAGSGQVGVSAVPVGRAVPGRGGPGGEAPEKQEATETPLSKEAATPSPGAGETQQDLRDASAGGADAPSRGDSPQGRKPVRPAQHSGRRRQVGVSPGERVALPPELQGCAVEVTLDPATAHPRLVLSEDRKSVRYGDTKQRLPNNPERFNISASVLGSKGFTSGRRYWEVEVGPKRGWAIGVARDSVQRKGKIQLKPDLGIWALDSLCVSQVPRKVGVYLDYEGGEVRFYNAETMALISSRTATFTGRLVPFFCLWTVGSHLSLSPGQR